MSNKKRKWGKMARVEIIKPNLITEEINTENNSKNEFVLMQE